VAATSLGDPLYTLLLSASRDGNGRVWSRPGGSISKRELTCQFVLEGHEGFVNSCAWFSHGGAGEG
jgi:WD40 repeat protein